MKNWKTGKENLIRQLSLDFALRIIKLYQYLRDNKQEYVMSKQVLRSGTSIGANISEGEQGQSLADFLSKYYIALKEANETKYWIELLYRAEYIDQKQFESIHKDCRIIVGTLVNCIKTIKENREESLKSLNS